MQERTRVVTSNKYLPWPLSDLQGIHRLSHVLSTMKLYTALTWLLATALSIATVVSSESSVYNLLLTFEGVYKADLRREGKSYQTNYY
jgi:hypothetical protein